MKFRKRNKHLLILNSKESYVKIKKPSENRLNFGLLRKYKNIRSVQF